MSWYVTFEVSRKDVTKESEEKLNEFVLNAEASGMIDEAREQFVLALAGAISLIESGGLGNPYGDYYVTLSGHANPVHEPVDGWANDCIQIQVAQKVRVDV